MYYTRDRKQLKGNEICVNIFIYACYYNLQCVLYILVRQQVNDYICKNISGKIYIGEKKYILRDPLVSI